MRKLRHGAIAIGLTLLLAALAAFAWIQTPSGKRQLARVIEDAVSDDTLTLALGEIEGFLPFELRLSTLALDDGDGVWLSLEGVTLDWSPLALLSGRLDVDAVQLQRVALDRLPKGSGQAKPGEPLSMPFELHVARLEVVELQLAEPVLGAPARLSISGAADLADPISGFRLTADVHRIDATQGALSIDLGFDPESGNLTAEIDGSEPSGGVIARLLDLPGLPPVTIGLSGDGPLEDWRADLTVDAGPEFLVDVELGVRADEDRYRLAIDAGAVLAGLLPDSAAPLLAERSTLRGDASIGRTGIVAFDGLTVSVAAGEVVLRGMVDWPGGLLDVAAVAVAGKPDVFAALLPDVGWGSAGADLRIEGPIAGPRIELAAFADDVTAAGLALGRLSTELAFDPVKITGLNAGGRFPFEGRGTLEGLSSGDAALDTLLAPPIVWAANGAFDLDGSMAIEQLSVEGAGAAIVATGDASTDGAIDATGTLKLAELSVFQDLAGLPLEGRADLSWSARSVAGGLAVGADGRLSQARSGIEVLDTLLAETVELRSTGTIGLDGEVEVTEFRIDSNGHMITGQVAYADSLLSSDWSLVLPDISGFSELAGVEVDGRLAADGRLQGAPERLTLQTRITGEALVFDGNAAPDLTAQINLDDLTGRLSGDVRLDALVAELPAVLETGIEMLESGAVRFDPVAGEFAGSTVSGALDLLSDGSLVGRLAARAEEVASLAGLLDLPLSGHADVAASLSSTNGRQGVQASLEMADAGYDGEIAAATISAELAVEDLLGELRLEGQATALDLSAGGAVFDRMDIEARGSADTLSVSLAIAGAPFDGEASGAVTLSDDATRVDLATLRAVIRGEAFELAGPAAITLSSEAVSVDRFIITGGDGQATVKGTLGDTLDASVELAGVSLALMSLVEPGLAFSGHVDGEARVSGPAGSPEGAFELRSSDLRSGFAGDTGLPPADVTATGRWSEGRLTLDVAAGLADGASMIVTADMPLNFDPSGGSPVIDPRSELAASAAGTLNLSLFDDLLAAGGNRVEGLMTVDLRVSGSMGEPVVAGTAVLGDGRYENAFYGSRLDGISAVITATGNALRLTDLSATTPGGGALAGSGLLTLDPDKGYPMLLDVGLRNGAVVDTALASATADADLRLSGTLMEKLLLSGEVSILGAEFRVPDRLPMSVPDIAVEEVNVPPEIAAGRAIQRPTEPAAAVDAQLDLIASARQAVFVRGRGLNVELDGNLTIKGSVAEPEIDGELGLRNGTFDIFGRRLTFQRGGLDFDGSSDLDPEVDLLAAADVDAVTVEVGVSGRVSEPKITLTSVPEMPQDEIAARLLFGKDVRSLSAFEAVTLAQSLGQLTGLTGGSGGILDEMRQRIGLDRLDVDVGGAGEASVSGGRYVSDGVYVGVEQGLDEQSSRVNVEIEVTPNITVESDVGADAEGRVGVSVEWDY